MLKIRKNGLTSVTEETLFSDINEALFDGKQVFLIVPEQQTLLAEKEAMNHLTPADTLHFEVTNFSRLCNTVFRHLGGVAERYANPTSKAILIWRALSEAAPELSKEMARPSAANVEEAARAIAEMQSLGIDADKLVAASQKPEIADSKKLQNKLCDLALILSAYAALTKEGFADSASDIAAATKLILENHDEMKGAAFFLDGFTSFTEPQLSLLMALMPRADLTVSLTLPKSDEDAYLYDETRKTVSTLIRLCRLASVKTDIPVQVISEEKESRLIDAGFDAVARELWHFIPNIDKNCLQNTHKYIKIYEADSPYEEAAFLASDIQKRVQEGAKYSDFAVISHDSSSLDGVLHATLSLCGIPHFLAQKRKVSAYEPFMAITAAYRAVLFGFSPEDVLTFAKCGYTKATLDDISEFEIYVKRYNIKGAFFAAPEMWSMNPQGYTERMQQNAGEILARIDQTRHAVIDPLLMLSEDVKNAVTVKDHATALYRFLCEIRMEDTLSEKALSLHAAKDFAAQDYARLYSILLDTLDTVVESAGEVAVDGKQFAELLSIAFSTADIGRIPAAFDEVTLGIADTLRVSGKKYVYLVDVNSGVFPSNAKDTSHFSDKEKLLLEAVGLPTSIGEDLRIARERFTFSRAFVSGSHGVTLITTKRNAALKSQVPAEILGRIAEITGGIVHLQPISSLSTDEAVYAPLYAVNRLTAETPDAATLAEALKSTAYGTQMKMSENIQNKTLSFSEETAKGLYPDRMFLSDTRLSRYADCPFSHYCRYVLKLDEQKDAAVGAMNIGNIVHEILEKYLKEMSENPQTGVAVLPDDERKAKVESIAKDTCNRLFGLDKRPSLQKAHFLERLIHAADRLVDSVSKELSRPENRFVPIDFELRIDKDGAVEPLVVKDKDKETAVVGKVDRIDAFTEGENVYLRVIDYKTGSKNFSPSDLYEGQNLQMFLYLNSLLASRAFAARFPADKTLKPAGVFYVPVSPDGLTAKSPTEAQALLDKNVAKYQGMISDDPAVFASVISPYFPMKYKIDNTLTKDSAEKVFSEESFEALKETVKNGVAATSLELRSGKIYATPMLKGKHASCEYCAFRHVCRSMM